MMKLTRKKHQRDQGAGKELAHTHGGLDEIWSCLFYTITASDKIPSFGTYLLYIAVFSTSSTTGQSLSMSTCQFDTANLTAGLPSHFVPEQ